MQWNPATLKADMSPKDKQFLKKVAANANGQIDE